MAKIEGTKPDNYKGTHRAGAGNYGSPYYTNPKHAAETSKKTK